jgi:hypothetical protein
MKKKILFILLFCLTQTYLRAAAFQELEPGLSAINSTPSSIEELEVFLRRNTGGVPFPEIGYSAFKLPFLTTKYSSRIEEMKAKTAAIAVFGQMVALGIVPLQSKWSVKKSPFHWFTFLLSVPEIEKAC